MIFTKIVDIINKNGPLMKRVNVNNQVELKSALESGYFPVCVGSEHFTVSGNDRISARENTRIEAWGNSQVSVLENSQVIARSNSRISAMENSLVIAWGDSRVTAWDNSQVSARGESQIKAWGKSRITAWDNSRIVASENSRIIALENSQVTASENSQVIAKEYSQIMASGNSRVTASGHSQIMASDTTFIKAGKYNVVTKIGPHVVVTGGILIDPPTIVTGQDWCKFYEVPVTNGLALVYKAVNDKYKSPFGQDYTPGSIPKAFDWDGGIEECGKGLHFSPSPRHALIFNSGATKFVACSVLVSEIVIHVDSFYPEKIKTSGCMTPVYEVDILGQALSISI